MLSRMHYVIHGYPTRQPRPPIISRDLTDADGVDWPITAQIIQQIPGTRALIIAKFSAVVKVR